MFKSLTLNIRNGFTRSLSLCLCILVSVGVPFAHLQAQTGLPSEEEMRKIGEDLGLEVPQMPNENPDFRLPLDGIPLPGLELPAECPMYIDPCREADLACGTGEAMDAGLEAVWQVLGASGWKACLASIIGAAAVEELIDHIFPSDRPPRESDVYDLVRAVADLGCEAVQCLPVTPPLTVACVAKAACAAGKQAALLITCEALKAECKQHKKTSLPIADPVTNEVDPDYTCPAEFRYVSASGCHTDSSGHRVPNSDENLANLCSAALGGRGIPPERFADCVNNCIRSSRVASCSDFSGRTQ